MTTVNRCFICNGGVIVESLPHKTHDIIDLCSDICKQKFTERLVDKRDAPFTPRFTFSVSKEFVKKYPTPEVLLPPAKTLKRYDHITSPTCSRNLLNDFNKIDDQMEDDTDGNCNQNNG
jgi:hypothetical protein